MSVGWEGWDDWGGREGDLPRLVPNREPSREEELGIDCWREGQSRLEVALRRMWGLLMMDPYRRMRERENREVKHKMFAACSVILELFTFSNQNVNLN